MSDYKNLLPLDFWHDSDGNELAPEVVYALDIPRLIEIDSVQANIKKALEK